MTKPVSSSLSTLPSPEMAAAAAGGLAVALRGWWEELNESPAWQDGAFFSLCAAYALVSAVALVQLIRIQLRVPEFGWTTQKVFHLMNFIVNGVRAVVFGFHAHVFLFQSKVYTLMLLDLPGLLFFSTYTLLVLFWAEIYHQAKNLPIRDGSAYAGVFHTACVDGGYGVVLKKARKVADGKDDANANVSLGAFVDTLVVLPDDLVQVIAKDFSLPTKDVCRTPDCDVVAASGSVKLQTSHVKDPKTFRTGNVSSLKQVEKCGRQGQEADISIGKNAPMNCNATNCGSPTGHVVPHLSWNGISSSATVGSKDGNVTNSVLTTPAVASDVKATQPANNSATKIVMLSKTTAKESKLNPCAKVFSPSFASSRPVLAAAPPVNSNYIPNSVTEVPTGVPVFDTNCIQGGSSLSSKVIHYNNLAPANYGISPQYVQPIVGHNVASLDPARIGAPYHPMQVGPTYISPSPQPVVGGKFSPVVYVHPVPQDAMHGAPVISQGWSRPVLLNSYQASLQNFQGTAPVYVAPPVMATGNLPLVVPSHAPLVQPFQTIRPIMVPAASSMVPGKYM